MRGLFRGQETGEPWKEPGESDTSTVDERPKKRERITSGGDNLNAFIGEGTTFKGNLSFQGTVRVDGRLEGEILTKDTLVVGSTAEIKADIDAGTLVVGGTIHGNVTAQKKIELQSGARLQGNISTPSLVIAEGVIFEGSCTMGKKQDSQPAAKSKEPKAPQPEKVLASEKV
jgi:cytoskeletal protein CcmA (bactofilin family)